MATYSCARGFVGTIRPLLETGDLELVLQCIRRQWSNPRLREFLFCECEESAKISLFCLSLVGTMEDCPAVASLLKHGDAYVSKLAEHAIWSIWFRAGGSERANLTLWQAVAMIGEDRLEEAEAHLSALLARCPEFAEAYNQRSIVHFFRGNYEEARLDLEETVRLNPFHFAAMASLGHCSAAQGDWAEAMACYRRALRIHPRCEGLVSALQQVQQYSCKAEGSQSGSELGQALPLRSAGGTADGHSPL